MNDERDNLFTRPAAFPVLPGRLPRLPHGHNMYAILAVTRAVGIGPKVLESRVRYVESPSTQQWPGGTRTGVGADGGRGFT